MGYHVHTKFISTIHDRGENILRICVKRCYGGRWRSVGMRVAVVKNIALMADNDAWQQEGRENLAILPNRARSKRAKQS